MRGRTIGMVVLSAIAGVFLVLALLLAYSSRALFDADGFADRASAALTDEAVSEEVAVRVGDELIEADPNLIAVRPVLESVIGGIVRGGAFQAAFRAGVADLHRAVFEQDESTVTLTLADIGATVRGALQALKPKLADRIPANSSVDLVNDEAPAALASVVRAAETVRWLEVVFLVIALASAFGAVWVAADRRGGVLAVGVAVALTAVVVLVLLRAAEALVIERVDDQQARDAAAGVWNAFLGDLNGALVLLAGGGAVVAAAASSLLRPVDLREQVERAWAFASRVPQRPLWRALRAVGLVVAGILIVVRHEQFLSLVAILAGLGIAYLGVAELMRMTIAGPGDAVADQRRGRATLLTAAIAAGIILGAGAIFIGADGLSERPLEVETSGCNGADDLCDRPLDEVAFAATHNSMSAATNARWLFAQQERGIPDQLHGGIRALLIDAHYGVETQSGAIKTDLSGLDRGERETYEDALGDAAVDAALRIRDRIVNSPEVGEPGVYLCHRFCELGAIHIEDAFTDLRDFLAANPEEVVVVVIEDYVDPQEIEAAAERTGLVDQIYTGPVGDPWPTLEEIIDTGGRAVVMAENDAGGGAIPWYHPAYEELVQETPFSFDRPALLTQPDKLTVSCEPNRGPADAGVFLINHWIDTSPAPKPSNAAKVNTREALLRRVHHCERQRDLLATLIAVDFYREGDVFGAVADLNSERTVATTDPG